MMPRRKPDEPQRSPAPKAARDCICNGSGLVTVLNNGRFAGAARWYPGEKFRPWKHTMLVVCMCPLGQWINSRRLAAGPDTPLFPEFDPQTMRVHAEFMRALIAAERSGDPEILAGLSATPGNDLDAFDPDKYTTWTPGPALQPKLSEEPAA